MLTINRLLNKSVLIFFRKRSWKLLTSCVLSRTVNINQHEIIWQCITGDLTELASMPASMSFTTKALNPSHTKLPVSVPTYQDNSFVFAICNSFSYATIPSCISLFFFSFMIFLNPFVSVLLTQHLTQGLFML